MLMKKVAEPQTLEEPVENGVFAYANITYGVPPVSWLNVLMSKTPIGLVTEHPAGTPVWAYWKSLMFPAVPGYGATPPAFAAIAVLHGATMKATAPLADWVFWKNASLHPSMKIVVLPWFTIDRKSTRLNSSHSQISYAVFCLKKKKT